MPFVYYWSVEVLFRKYLPVHPCKLKGIWAYPFSASDHQIMYWSLSSIWSWVSRKVKKKIWFHFYICSNPVFREHLWKHYLFSILFFVVVLFRLFGISDKHQVIPVDCTYVWILNYIPLKYVSVNASTTLFYN